MNAATLFVCAGIFTGMGACQVSADQTSAHDLLYTELTFLEPLTIELDVNSVIQSDYGVPDAFCPGTNGFCLIAPMVTSSLDEVGTLRTWAIRNGWEVSWEERGNLKQLPRLIVTDTRDSISWVSVYTDGDYPMIVYSAKKYRGTFEPLGPIFLLTRDSVGAD